MFGKIVITWNCNKREGDHLRFYVKVKKKDIGIGFESERDFEWTDGVDKLLDEIGQELPNDP